MSSPAVESAATATNTPFSKLRQNRNYQPPRRKVLTHRQMSADSLRNRQDLDPFPDPDGRQEDPVTDCETYDDDEVSTEQ